MWFQLTLFFPPLSFFTPFSFQTGKSVPRSGSVFPPRLFLPKPGPSSRPGASWWGARWKPLCARERGAAPAAAHGRSHPARTPRRRTQLFQGPSAAPRRPGARQRLSGEVPAAGIGMILLFLLWLGECLGAGGRPKDPGKHIPASAPGRWLSTVVSAVPGVSQIPLSLPPRYGEAHLGAEGRPVGHGKRLTHLGPGAGLGLGLVPDPVGVSRLMWRVLLGDGV